MSTLSDALINSLAATARGWRGSMAFPNRKGQPEKLLKLYDIEVSPYCRLVREVLTECDLDVLILPCPSGGTRFRPEAKQIGGKAQFPLLVDDNTQTVLYESADIIDYVLKHYAGRGPRARGLRRRFEVGSSFVSSILLYRPGGMTGMKARSSRAPEKPLELFSFEASPYSKRVRARLSELELPYILHNTGKGHWRDMGPPSFRDRLFKGELGTTRNRKWLAENTGKVQLPYLIDPNTETSMYESAAILRYLEATYAV